MRRRAAGLLLLCGMLQMAGDAIGSPALRGLGLATGMAPAPRVFTAFDGFEPYSTRFFIEWDDRAAGGVVSLPVTPRRYSRLRGPYNRRNVYGAALAGGPVLAADPRLEPMWLSVTAYALCGEAPLLGELGVDPGRVRGAPRIRYEARPGGRLDAARSVMRAPCS